MTFYDSVILTHSLEYASCVDKFLIGKRRCLAPSGLHDAGGSCAACLFAVNLRISHLKGKMLRLCYAVCGGTRMNTHELCSTCFFPHITAMARPRRGISTEQRKELWSITETKQHMVLYAAIKDCLDWPSYYFGALRITIVLQN